MIVESSGHTQQLSNIQGLICIDCWEDSKLNLYYDRLENNLDLAQFDSIVVANYELALDSTDMCQFNTMQVYSWETFTPDIVLPLVKESRLKKTSNWLQSKLSSNSFLLLDSQSLVHHITTAVPHVTNWLVIGGGWQVCTHGRPVGFGTLQLLPYDFYIAPWSLYNTNSNNLTVSINDIAQDKFIWEDQGNNLFRLKND